MLGAGGRGGCHHYAGSHHIERKYLNTDWSMGGLKGERVIVDRRQILGRSRERLKRGIALTSLSMLLPAFVPGTSFGSEIKEFGRKQIMDA
jgi:hypothetical protein